MGNDLEHAVDAVEATYPGEITREGSVLTGFSRGAYAAAAIAARHPGRWPYLILVEGDVTLTVPMLERAKVRAVAMLAGEWGTQREGSRKTCEALAKQGYPARFFLMPRAGHYYSADIDERMREALAFVLAGDLAWPRAMSYPCHSRLCTTGSCSARSRSRSRFPTCKHNGACTHL
jgi:pimeloyl-ACP methyl ester carboxylesterase